MRWLVDPGTQFGAGGKGRLGQARWIAEGLRLERGSDSALRQSGERFPMEEVFALALEPSDGGGWLFYGQSAGETLLWTARTWTGELRPLGRVAEAVSQVTAGFGRAFLRLTVTDRLVALDLTTGEVTTPAPLPVSGAVLSLAIVDAWFAAVSVDVRGVLVTFDAGDTWTALGPEWSGARVEVAGERIRLSSGTRNRWLGRDGSWGAEPVKDAEDSGEVDGELMLSGVRSLLRKAVLHGAALRDGTAAVVQSGSVYRLNLRDGAIVSQRAWQAPGADGCHGVPLFEGVGFVCREPASGTAIYKLLADGRLLLVRRFVGERKVWPNGSGAVLVSGSCGSPRAAEGQLCELRRNGSVQTLSVSPQAGQPLVALKDGGVAQLQPPRSDDDGFVLLRRDGRVRKVALSLPGDEDVVALLRHGQWLDGLELFEENFATWVVGDQRITGVIISSDGRVQHTGLKKANAGNTLLSGALAMVAFGSGVAEQSLDFGKNWHRLNPPSSLALPSETTVVPLSLREQGCSALGCVVGPWLAVRSADKAHGGLRSAPAPDLRIHNPSAYPDWGLRCVRQLERAPSASQHAARLNQRLGARASVGVRRGFSNWAVPYPLEKSRSAVRLPLEGVGVPAHWLSAGSDHSPPFRAYVWRDGGAWPRGARWAVRVARRFTRDGGLWDTAPTEVPWATPARAGEAFGVVPKSTFSANWALELDASERAGLLRVGSRANTQLHVLEEGKAIASFGELSLGSLAGVAKAGGSWYFGQRSGAEFSVHRITDEGPVQVGEYWVGSVNRPQIVGSVDHESIGILLRTSIGEWFVYPLDTEGRPGLPLPFSRKQLNQQPQLCRAHESGWLVRSALPLTRFSSGAPRRFVELSGTKPSLVELTARVVIGPHGLCLRDLAAKHPAENDTRGWPPPAEAVDRFGVPLVVRDVGGAKRVVFHCVR